MANQFHDLQILVQSGSVRAETQASSLSSYSIHGNVYIFDLSMLGSTSEGCIWTSFTENRKLDTGEFY